MFWKDTNRGKKGFSLDIRLPEGQTLFFGLLAQSDAPVENFRTGTAHRKMGLQGAGALDALPLSHLSRSCIPSP
ncbi:CoA transferase [Diaphorobacter caeni]|uniref:CoA transferase n=1 Tax=Diaphorobacter caeni TaxID=2784387 RepID=UPI00188DD0B9|nr:CoA transferase [Diaphorobacter caeni]